jgi:succinate dehydrogenase / fumarate reductase cytochrome b subunit
MSWLFDFWRSSIGGKVAMAITGVLLFGFVVAHLTGNLLLFAGADAINAYAKWLADKGALLWVARGGLLFVFLLHVVTGIRLARTNRLARPVAYASEATVAATFASRSMVFSGLTLLVFILYHLLHFTFGVTNPDHFARKAMRAEGHDVFSMMTASFSVPAIAIAYAAAQIGLFLHLRHGIQSFAQTLGLRHARWTPLIETLSLVIAALIAIGNATLALSVLTGIVKVMP